jgi:glyoxylase-like metal-dependent hydrolase (beta-lactamase superfamily II)
VILALAAGLDCADLQFLGRPGIIATAVLRGADGVALIDPGPATTIDTLRAALRERGISFGEIRQLLLTHIHLDHAGATGTLVRENPAIEVLVHQRGAPHMEDPERLLASATRLYGEADMARLWGEFLPVPRGNLRALAGGETITAVGREMQVAYTPGHASHHVSFFDQASRVAFVGDTAGIRRGAGDYVMPPTPPPDIDLELWRGSEERILAWDPDMLFMAHFGPFHGARLQFQQLRANIEGWSRIVKRLISDANLTEEQRQDRFVEDAQRELRRAVGEQEADHYARAGRLDYSWQGLARYWRKRAVASR